MNKEKRIEILKILRDVMPNVTTELEHKTPFELLIAVVLSAQATDKSVNIATRQIFPEANTPEGILAFGEDRFRECIKHVGLYKGKTKNVMRLCEILRDEYNSQVPQDVEALQKLPGVGKKTASVVMNVAFNAPFIGVDTHVFRVANRTGYAKGKTPQQVQIKMEKYTPAPFRPKAHQWFLRIGRYICKARIPECWRCPIQFLCEYKDKVLEKPEPKKTKKLQHPQPEVEVNETENLLPYGPQLEVPELEAPEKEDKVSAPELEETPKNEEVKKEENVPASEIVESPKKEETEKEEKVSSPALKEASEKEEKENAPTLEEAPKSQEAENEESVSAPNLKVSSENGANEKESAKVSTPKMEEAPETEEAAKTDKVSTPEIGEVSEDEKAENEEKVSAQDPEPQEASINKETKKEEEKTTSTETP